MSLLKITLVKIFLTFTHRCIGLGDVYFIHVVELDLKLSSIYFYQHPYVQLSANSNHVYAEINGIINFETELLKVTLEPRGTIIF